MNNIFSYNEPQEQINNWLDELQFIHIELQFLRHFIQSYPFKSNTPNLFEHIELFKKQFKDVDVNRQELFRKMNNSIMLVDTEVESKDVDYSVKIQYDKLLKEVSEFRQEYRLIKAKLYEHVTNIMR